jgi:hypothetical protein
MRFHYHGDHRLQLGRRIFDFVIFMLTCPALRSEHAASMNIFEIAVGKFVSSFRTLGVPIVDPEMPFCIFAEPMETDELVLCHRRRLMFTPRSPAVRNDVPLPDKFFSVLQSANVYLYCISVLLVVAKRRRNRAKKSKCRTKKHGRYPFSFQIHQIAQTLLFCVPQEGSSIQFNECAI